MRCDRNRWRLRAPKHIVASLLVLVLMTLPVLGKDRAFRSTLHGNRERGPARRPDLERGSCVQCHDGHASHKRKSPDADKGLFTPNDNRLCFSCHDAPSDLTIFPSAGEWMLSSHAISPRVVADGRPSTDSNKCVNCHDPHGVKKRGKLVPSLLSEEETRLCLSCHDGSQGADVAGQVLRGGVHGEYALGTHDAREAGDPDMFAAIPPSRRHIGCSDCHNPHVAGEDRRLPEPPYASRRLAGVSRVQVVNGSSGMPPSYEWVGAGDPQPAREYEICFKCHSSWTKQPAGQPDMALLTNPANPSFHPIQSVGTNRNIDPRAFTDGVSEDTVLVCSSCHSGDDSRVKGPHASSHPYLLGKPTVANESRARMTREDVCFGCHVYEVYADASSPAATLGASRFNLPSSSGHAFHVDTHEVTCYACHETHGSTVHPNLVARGRVWGVGSFRQTFAGGECTSACHGPRSYDVNYPR